MRWYLKVLRDFGTLSGRASRQELWMFVLVNSLVSLALIAVDRATGLTFTFGHRGMGFLQGFYGIVTAFPYIAVSVRRLHDIGRSGWFFLVGFIPIVGVLLLVYWYCRASDPGSNAYGPPAPRDTDTRVAG
jgi:uncharacterized membrane protein YhaH (DUF805 family)